MLKQPGAQEGPGPAVFALWRGMTSAFKGQAGSRTEIAQSLPLLPAPASSRGAESTQAWGDNGQGSDPEVELPGKDQADLPQAAFWVASGERVAGCHQEKGFRRCTTTHGHAPGAISLPPRALSWRAEATRRLSKHNKPSKRELEPGERL